MKIKRIGSQASQTGPAEYFTGIVRIDPLFEGSEPSRVVGTSVTFEPGARSAWHTHPLGQTLAVTAGCGLVQCAGEPAQMIRPGDVVQCPAGEKHWHGAMPTTAMTHTAIQEALDGKVIDWLEKVSDEEYQAALDSLENGRIDNPSASDARDLRSDRLTDPPNIRRQVRRTKAK